MNQLIIFFVIIVSQGINQDKSIPLFQGNLEIAPNDSTIKYFRLAPGDWISVYAEGKRQDKSSTIINSINLIEFNDEMVAQSGDSQIIEIKYFTVTGGPFLISFINKDNETKLYNIKLGRIPIHDSLIMFDTKFIPGDQYKHSELNKVERKDTLASLILDKSGHLSPGDNYYEQFTIKDPKGKLVIWMSNEESFNNLTEGFGGKMTSVVISLACGLPIVDLSGFKVGKDIGFQIFCLDDQGSEWKFLYPYTKTNFENRIVDLEQYPYNSWSILVDNSYSKFTSKNYHLQIYTVIIK